MVELKPVKGLRLLVPYYAASGGAETRLNHFCCRCFCPSFAVFLTPPSSDGKDRDHSTFEHSSVPPSRIHRAPARAIESRPSYYIISLDHVLWRTSIQGMGRGREYNVVVDNAVCYVIYLLCKGKIQGDDGTHDYIY